VPTSPIDGSNLAGYMKIYLGKRALYIRKVDLRKVGDTKKSGFFFDTYREEGAGMFGGRESFSVTVPSEFG